MDGIHKPGWAPTCTETFDEVVCRKADDRGEQEARIFLSTRDIECTFYLHSYVRTNVVDLVDTFLRYRLQRVVLWTSIYEYQYCHHRCVSSLFGHFEGLSGTRLPNH